MAKGDDILGEPLESGDVIYERDIQHLVEPEHNGKYAAIDLRTGEYEIAESKDDSTRRLLKNRPWDTIAWVQRIGYPVTRLKLPTGEYREPMPPMTIPKDIAERGRSIYKQDIGHLLEPEHNGKFVAIDIHSSEHEIDECPWTAKRRLLKRRPNAKAALVKVGAPDPPPFPWATIFLVRDD